MNIAVFLCNVANLQCAIFSRARSKTIYAKHPNISQFSKSGSNTNDLFCRIKFAVKQDMCDVCKSCCTATYTQSIFIWYYLYTCRLVSSVVQTVKFHSVLIQTLSVFLIEYARRRKMVKQSPFSLSLDSRFIEKYPAGISFL